MNKKQKALALVSISVCLAIITFFESLSLFSRMKNGLSEIARYEAALEALPAISESSAHTEKNAIPQNERTPRCTSITELTNVLKNNLDDCNITPSRFSITSGKRYSTVEFLITCKSYDLLCFLKKTPCSDVNYSYSYLSIKQSHEGGKVDAIIKFQYEN